MLRAMVSSRVGMGVGVGSLLLAVVAHAQSAPSPYPQPQPYPQPYAAPAPSLFIPPLKHFRIDVMLGGALPAGDIDNGDLIGTSFGIGGGFGYYFSRNVSVEAILHVIVPNVKGAPDGYTVTQADFGAGARFTLPLSLQASLFGQAHVLSTQFREAYMGDSVTESGVGFGFAIGGEFHLNPGMSLGVRIGHQNTQLEFMNTDADFAWTTVEGAFSFRF